jgi:hypothetical protein
MTDPEPSPTYNGLAAEPVEFHGPGRDGIVMVPVPQLAPEGSDAAAYLLLGQQCAATGACWDPLRPVGAVLYFSLPYRLGLPAESIVLLNWALLALSVTLAARVMVALFPVDTRFRTAWAASIALVSHLAFMALPACNSLSDVPAACLLLIGLELSALWWRSGSPGWLAAAGLSLGAAAFLRAFYLYPVLLAGLALGVSALFRRRLGRALWLLVPCVLPIAIQLTTTYLRTSTLSYLGATTERHWRARHLSSPWYGYDTLVPAQALPYTPSEDKAVSGTLSGPLRSGNVMGTTRLITRRLAFYFGSWVPLGGVYLHAAKERVTSTWILALQALVAGTALLAAALVRPRDGLELPLVALGAILVQGLVIVPEARFIMALQVVLWMMALATAANLLARTVGASSISR